jgi:hypothetical protein
VKKLREFLGFFYFCSEFIKPISMYILKVKGSARIPDYIQVRDSKFTLIAYFSAEHKKQGLQQCGLTEKISDIEKILAEIPYGKIYKLPF